MNRYLPLVVLSLLLFFSNTVFAQKSIKIDVTGSSVTGVSTSCDCCFNNEDPIWLLNINGSCQDYYEGNQDNSGTVNYSFTRTIYNTSYLCLSDVPSTINIGFKECEDDGVASCIAYICDGTNISTSKNITTTINTSGTVSGSASATGSGCAGTSTSISYNVITGGSWQTTKNQDASGNITNTSCITAIDITSGIGAQPTNGSWRSKVVNQHIKRCGDIYYKFQLTANVDYFEIDMYNNDGDVDVYYMNADGTCGCAVTDDGSVLYDFKKNNPALGWYIVKLRNGGDYADVDFRTGNSVTRPSNDNFCNATNLSSSFSYNSTALSNTVNTDNASTEDICSTDEPTYSNEKTVWWKFTTSANPPAQIILNPSASGLCTGQARVYSGTAAGTCSGGVFTSYSSNAFSGLTQIDYTDLGNNFYINCPNANTTYYIMGKVGGACSSGSLTINVSSNGAPKPSNDLCASATDLGTLTSGTTIGDAAGNNRWNNFCATGTETSPGWTLDGTVRQSVWYKFNTGSVGRKVDISAYNDPHSWGDQMDIKLALYKGPCGTLTYVDRAYDIGSFSEDMARQYCLLPNTDYYIMVDGSGVNTQGFFGLIVKDLGPYPVNDDICSATKLQTAAEYTSVPRQYNYTNFVNLPNETNINGTYCDPVNPSWGLAGAGGGNDAGVWYYFDAPGRTLVLEGNSLSSDNIDLQYALYESSAAVGVCPTSAQLTEVGKAWDAGLYDEDAYFNCLNPGKRYYLLVDGSSTSVLLGNGKEGNFQLKAWFPEEGEITFCNAENLGTVPTNGSITKLNLANKCGTNTTTTMGTSGTVTLPSSFSLDNTVIYKFTAPASGSVRIDASDNPYYPGAMGTLSGDEVDLQLAVFEMSGALCSNANFFPKGSNYDVTNGFSEDLIVNCLNPGQVYYLMVDGSGVNPSGYYDITISDYKKQTTNDFLCNAKSIAKTYTATWSQCNYGSTATDTAMITGENNYCATITNDLPASLGTKPSTWNAATGGVWYKFVAPKSGKLTIQAKNSISDIAPPYDEPEISVAMALFFLPGGYQGTCANLGTEKDRLQYISSNFDAAFHDEDFTVECLMPDSTYYLLVDGQAENVFCPTCDRGEFYLTLRPDPKDRPANNDLICNAINLGTPTSTGVDTKVSPATGAATLTSPATGYGPAHNLARNAAGVCQRAENNYCASNTGETNVNSTGFSLWTLDNTVWYKFTAPSTGSVNILVENDPSSLGDNIDPQFAVFESSDGTCSGTMSLVDASYTPLGNETKDVQCLEPGQTYWIAVDGSSGTLGLDQGYFEVTVKQIPATMSAPANNDICSATVISTASLFPAAKTVTLNNQTNKCANVQSGVYPLPQISSTFAADGLQHDVWYKFTTPASPASNAVQINITSQLPWPFGDAMDPQIAVYEASSTSCASATFKEVESSWGIVPFTETVEVQCLKPSTDYYVLVDGSSVNTEGNFTFEIKSITPLPFPVNDHKCDPTTTTNGNLGTLGAATGATLGSHASGQEWYNFCADATGDPVPSAFGLDKTVWFKFTTPNTAPNNVNVTIEGKSDPNGKGNSVDLQMALWQATSCSGTLSEVKSTDPLLSFDASITACLASNTVYYVQVDGSSLNTEGYFTLKVINNGTPSAPANDNICNAKTLPSGGAITGSPTGYLNDNNYCATIEANESMHTASSVQRSVWYKFTCPTSADVTVQVKGNSLNPFSSSYFLPDITIWELNDATSSISGCPSTPAFATKLTDNWHQDIPNSLANGLYPTVNLTPLCLKPGYTYYVQVDGISGIGVEGDFDITIKDNQPSYAGPTNNECAGAITLTVNSKSCQLSSGTWATKNYGDPTWSRQPGGCTADCGDIWYKFTMPAACGNNTQSFVKIEGNDELGTLGITNSDLAIAAYRGSCGSLSYIKCSTGGSGADPDFSITGTPGETIYLQVWDMNGDNQGQDFQICVSEQKSADDCADATAMTLDLPYCWSIEAATGETPSSAAPGSGLTTCSGNPKHSTYFKFTTDNATNFCDDYYIYLYAPGLAHDITGTALNACVAGTSPSTTFSMAVWEVNAGATLCTPGASNVTQRDCETFNDCGTGAFGSNVSGPHGNGGVINDTIYYNLGSGFAFKPNTTYYIVLDYDVSTLYAGSREVLDGTITVGRRCKGRVWEYTTTVGTVSTNKYCTSSDGWRHYYDDKGTVATGDDKYIFSLYPNGNNFEGTVNITLDNARHNYEDVPNDYAEYVMKRRWDFHIDAGTIDPAKPVKVRFYYQTAEKQDIIDAANTFKNAYGGYYEDFEWFKSANGHVFDVVNDVNPKVISVGPNGFSETGCLSFWDANGVFHSTPVTRCQAIAVSDWEDDNTNQWCNGVHYAEYNGITGFSGGTGGTGVSPWDLSPLPVELTSFTGYNDGNKNVLNWTTASELNTFKFEVERKTSDSNAFVYVGEKPAYGNSSQFLTYSLDDLSPREGNNYYRLKIIDRDGTFKYSQTILINIAKNIEYTDVISRVFPNPTNNTLYVDYQSALNSTITLRVLNSIGQEMLNNKIVVVKGNQQFKLDVSSFAKGVYILNIQDTGSGKNLQTKFVKE